MFIPSLNLNKSPKECKNGSMIFAKNIKLSSNGDFITNEEGFKYVGSEIKGRIIEIIPCETEYVVLSREIGTIDNNSHIYRCKEDVNGDITNFSSKCESGKVEVDGIFSEFSGTIAEINEYMNLLKENYANYQSLQSELISASSELSALSVSNSNSINTSRISTLNSTIASLKNKMKDYQEITSIDSCGKWVEK